MAGFGEIGGRGSLLKRTLAGMDRENHYQQQLQQGLLLRSVKQRTSHGVSGFSPAVLGPAACESISAAPQSSTSTVAWSETVKSSMRNQLRELERQLLLDDDDDDDYEASASASVVTDANWDVTLEEFVSELTPQPPPATAAVHSRSLSPTNSSSTVSSSASCSQPSVPSPPPPPSLRQLLLDAAAAIGECNLEIAAPNLEAIRRVANPRGDAEQRLTALMYATLLSRCNSSQARSSHALADLCNPEHFLATQMLYDLSPCFKLAFIAANSAILEATKGEPNIHIVDFEVGQGNQYVALLHTLAEERRRGSLLRAPAVRLTAVVDPSSLFTNLNNGNLRAVGDRIEKLAERAGVGLRFNVVSRRAGELDEASLGCEPGEVLVVNLSFVLSRVPDESVDPDNPRDELLRRVRALRPRLVALAEQEINTCTAAFPARFAEACGHYGSLLESLEATKGSAESERVRAEAGLARRAANAVAWEGAERVERCEVYGKWRARMGMAGLKPVRLGPDVLEKVKSRLARAGSNPGFTIKDESGGDAVGFGWKGRVLTVSSTWC